MTAMYINWCCGWVRPGFLCTLAINKRDVQPIIVNRRELKAVNQRYNKVRAEFQSLLTGKRKSSKRLRLLTQKRNRRIDDAMHQASRIVINYCVENNVSTLVIGYSDQWKQGIAIGKCNNRQFVQIPHRQLTTGLSIRGRWLVSLL
ncbi:MAG: transposase [Hormoscilla sp. SP12CHS1]|nr:transposase [Hormoscilla sp. SP12CHS1]